MMVTSWFFWPSPAVALIGAVLLPVAVRVGLPALGAAMAMNLFGHGIALSGDYIIQGAPKLTADAAGLPVSSVMEASIPLVIVMGLVTTITAFWMMRRDMKNGKWRSGLIDTRLEESGGLVPVEEEGKVLIWRAIEENSSYCNSRALCFRCHCYVRLQFARRRCNRSRRRYSGIYPHRGYIDRAPECKAGENYLVSH